MRENTQINVAVPAANTPVVATLPAAAADHRWRLRAVIAGYSAAPTGGLLTISDGAAVIFSVPVAAGGLIPLPPLDIQCGAGKSITGTLAAGGAGITGYVTLIGAYE